MECLPKEESIILRILSRDRHTKCRLAVRDQTLLVHSMRCMSIAFAGHKKVHIAPLVVLLSFKYHLSLGYSGVPRHAMLKDKEMSAMASLWTELVEGFSSFPGNGSYQTQAQKRRAELALPVLGG